MSPHRAQKQGGQMPGQWGVWGGDHFRFPVPEHMGCSLSSHVYTKISKLDHRFKSSLRHSLIWKKYMNQNWNASPTSWHEITKDSSWRPERTLKQNIQKCPFPIYLWEIKFEWHRPQLTFFCTTPQKSEPIPQLKCCTNWAQGSRHWLRQYILTTTLTTRTVKYHTQ